MSKSLAQTASQPRKRGRPARLSLDKIARAALDIGVDKATVTAVAAHLDVDHSSLYRHVKSQKEIVSCATELAIAELGWRGAPGVDWRGDLIALTDSIWELYERHPGLAEAFRSMEFMPVSAIRAFVDATARMQAHGFTLDDAVLAVDMMVDLVGDCFLGWRAMAEVDRQRAEDRQIQRLWEKAALDQPERAVQIGAMIAVMRAGPRPWWESKRDLVLDGLAPRRIVVA